MKVPCVSVYLSSSDKASCISLSLSAGDSALVSPSARHNNLGHSDWAEEKESTFTCPKQFCLVPINTHTHTPHGSFQCYGRGPLRKQSDLMNNLTPFSSKGEKNIFFLSCNVVFLRRNTSCRST